MNIYSTPGTWKTSHHLIFTTTQWDKHCSYFTEEKVRPRMIKPLAGSHASNRVKSTLESQGNLVWFKDKGVIWTQPTHCLWGCPLAGYLAGPDLYLGIKWAPGSRGQQQLLKKKPLLMIPQPGLQKLRPQAAMTQKWVWLQQEMVFLAQIEQLSTLGPGSLSRDADRHQPPCIFGWYQQETPGDKLESQSRNTGLGWEGRTRGPDLATHIKTTAGDSDHSGRGINHSWTSPGQVAGDQAVLLLGKRIVFFNPDQWRPDD